MALLTRVTTKNFRSLADVAVDVGPVTVLFGPNGSGKSSFLDSIWFVRDCAVLGVDATSAHRSHGIGLLWDGAGDSTSVRINLRTDALEYELGVDLASGRIDPLPSEFARPLDAPDRLFQRLAGTSKLRLGDDKSLSLREPQRLAFGPYLDRHPDARDVERLDRLLRDTHWYHSRSFEWSQLKARGSEIGPSLVLADDAHNLWSVLRNLHDRRSIDGRYETILRRMQQAFPSFRDIVFEQTGRASLYCSFVDADRRAPVPASSVSDGHIQLLILLTALFAEDRRESLLLFDEPEISLHPWPIAVLAQAIGEAAKAFERQVMLATHSPVLLSQFAPHEILAAALVGGQTHLQRISELAEIKDLLEQYALGSLFMAEAVAPQSARGP